MISWSSLIQSKQSSVVLKQQLCVNHKAKSMFFLLSLGHADGNLTYEIFNVICIEYSCMSLEHHLVCHNNAYRTTVIFENLRWSMNSLKTPYFLSWITDKMLKGDISVVNCTMLQGPIDCNSIVIWPFWCRQATRRYLCWFISVTCAKASKLNQHTQTYIIYMYMNIYIYIYISRARVQLKINTHTHTDVEIVTCAFQTDFQSSSVLSAMSMGLCFVTQCLWHETNVLGTTSNWRCFLSLDIASSILYGTTIIYRLICVFICISLCQSIKIKPTNFNSTVI